MFIKKVKINLEKFGPAKDFNERKPEEKMPDDKSQPGALPRFHFVGHRYGPEDRPPPLSPEKGKTKIQTRIPLAFCHECKCDRPMKWKPKRMRGKDVDSWFYCAVCGCGVLTIRKISCDEAVEMNSKNRKEPCP
jgi:hypothetical protein